MPSTLQIFYKDIDLEGWSGSTLACESVSYTGATVYFSGSPAPADWSEAYISGSTVFADSGYTTVWQGVVGNNWYKSESGSTEGVTIEITGGSITDLMSCTMTPSPTTTPTVTPTPTLTSNNSECWILSSAPFGGCSIQYKNQFGSTITLNILSLIHI